MRDHVRPLASQPLADVLASHAARTAGPGGGSAAAIAAALGASLATMAAAYAGDRTAQEQAAGLLDRAVALADEDLAAFPPVLEAQRLERDDPGRPARLAQALSGAAGVPLAIAAVAADAAELAAHLVREGRPMLAGDAATGAVLCEAACRAALHMAELNMRAADRIREAPAPDPRFADIAALAARAARAREEALG